MMSISWGKFHFWVDYVLLFFEKSYGVSIKSLLYNKTERTKQMIVFTGLPQY